MFKSKDDLSSLLSTNLVSVKTVEHQDIKSIKDIKEIKNNVGGLMEQNVIHSKATLIWNKKDLN